MVFPAVAAAVAAVVRGKRYSLFSKSLMTSPAIMNPTTGGTKGVEPGVLLL